MYLFCRSKLLKTFLFLIISLALPLVAHARVPMCHGGEVIWKDGLAVGCKFSTFGTSEESMCKGTTVLHPQEPKGDCWVCVISENVGAVKDRSRWAEFSVGANQSGAPEADFSCLGMEEEQPQPILSCCQNNSIVWTETGMFYAINNKGQLVRVFWSNNGWSREIVDTSAVKSQLVRGSMVARNTSHVAAVTEDHQLVITAGKPGRIRLMELDLARLYPCSLVVTGKYGIFAVNLVGDLYRAFLHNSSWVVERIHTYGGNLLPGSMTEMNDGRVGGLNEKGELWNLWWNVDKEALQFNIITGGGNDFIN